MQKTTRRKQDEARFNKLSSKQTSHAVVETNQPVAELRPCSELHSLDGVRTPGSHKHRFKIFSRPKQGIFCEISWSLHI